METLKVLHLEDNAHDAMLMQALIASESESNTYDVVHVDNLRDALWNIKFQGYNAILLDLGENETRGLDSLRAIRHENSEIPVVVLSGMKDEDVTMRALDEGAQECLLKGHSDGKVINLALRASVHRKEKEKHNKPPAHYDDVTGLPTGHLFSEHLHYAMDLAQRWDRKLSVMFVDVFGMTHIKETHSTEAANKALLEVSYRLKTTLRNTDMVARYSDDQFLVLLDDHSKYMERSTKSIATKIQKALDTDYEYKGEDLELAAGIGIAILKEGGWHYRPSNASRFIATSTGIHPVLDNVNATAFSHRD